MFPCVKTFINRMQSIKMGRKKNCRKMYFVKRNIFSCPWLVSLINKRHLSLKSFFLEKSLKCFSNKLKLTVLYLKERKHIFVLIDPQQWTREKCNSRKEKPFCCELETQNWPILLIFSVLFWKHFIISR